MEGRGRRIHGKDAYKSAPFWWSKDLFAWFLSVIAVVNCEYIVHACRSSRVQVDCIGRQASIPLANLDYIYRSTIDLLVVW
jgi:hypothetical protein